MSLKSLTDQYLMTDRHLISSILTHLASMLSQIERSAEWKQMLDGLGADPEIQGDLYDAINALNLVADKYAYTVELQTAILEDRANDDAETARSFEEQPSP